MTEQQQVLIRTLTDQFEEKHSSTCNRNQSSLAIMVCKNVITKRKIKFGLRKPRDGTMLRVAKSQIQLSE